MIQITKTEATTRKEGCDMDQFERSLNALLIETFRDILEVEALILQRSDPGLSINEVHLIESVRHGENHSRTVSEIASDLRIAVPSATVAVNKLERKGYLKKERSSDDGRSVRITLTREGEKIYRLHWFIHLKLVKAAAEDMNDQEKEALLAGVRHLDAFFKNKMAKYGGMNELSNRRNRKSPSGSRPDKRNGIGDR
jgi:DNA-binding MarR family transcriptional regulator